MSGAPQLQSPASEAAAEVASQAVAGSNASMQAGAEKDMKQKSLASVSVHAKDDIPQGKVCSCLQCLPSTVLNPLTESPMSHAVMPSVVASCALMSFTYAGCTL